MDGWMDGLIHDRYNEKKVQVRQNTNKILLDEMILYRYSRDMREIVVTTNNGII